MGDDMNRGVLLGVITCLGEFHQGTLADLLEGIFRQDLRVLRDGLHLYECGGHLAR